MIEPNVEVVLLDADGNDVTPADKPKVFDTWYGVPEGEVRVEDVTSSRLVLKMLPAAGIGKHTEEGALPDVPVGTLPVATLDPNSGDLTTVGVRFPTPEPFTEQGIDDMWAALASSPGQLRAFVRRRALWGDAERGGQLAVDDVFVPALPTLVALARHLLARWPQTETMEKVWRATDVPGGREDVRATLRRLSRIPVVATPSHPVPVRTARRRAATKDWELNAVSSVAAELARRLRAGGVQGQDVESVARPIDQVALRSRPPSRQLDPPPSAWPWPLRYFYTTAIESLAAVIATAAGSAEAPLTHLWRLYEAWVTTEVIEAVSQWKGRDPDELSGVLWSHKLGPVWRARWSDQRETVEVWSQLDIGRDKRDLCGDPDFTVRSVTSKLIPDVVLAVRRDGDARILAIDAKHTGSGQAAAGVVGETGSKYLWGLRAEHPTASAELQEVVVVSSGPPATMLDPPEARIDSVQAHPGSTPLMTELALATRL